MIVRWSFNHPTIYHGIHLCLDIANDLYLAIGVTWIDQKVTIIQLRYQFNSYNLVHIQEP
jgi:hypothetical protein